MLRSNTCPYSHSKYDKLIYLYMNVTTLNPVLLFQGKLFSDLIESFLVCVIEV